MAVTYSYNSDTFPSSVDDNWDPYNQIVSQQLSHSYKKMNVALHRTQCHNGMVKTAWDYLNKIIVVDIVFTCFTIYHATVP